MLHFEHIIKHIESGTMRIIIYMFNNYTVSTGNPTLTSLQITFNVLIESCSGTAMGALFAKVKQEFNYGSDT